MEGVIFVKNVRVEKKEKDSIVFLKTNLTAKERDNEEEINIEDYMQTSTKNRPTKKIKTREET